MRYFGMALRVGMQDVGHVRGGAQHVFAGLELHHIHRAIALC